MMSLANARERDDQLLIRYLVGVLPEDETERLDELSVSDDRFAADLRAVEHDLVDAYVSGALSGDTLRGFETHYLSAPAGRAKVTLAEALLRYRGTATAASPGDAVEAPAPRTPMPWAWAAAAALLLAATGYLL